MRFQKPALPKRRSRHGRGLAWRALLVLFGLISSIDTHVAMSAQVLVQPPSQQVASALDLAAENALPAGYPALDGVPAVPTVLLKAVAWVESGWRQFRAPGVPLISRDGGYGVMQVTHGLGGLPATSVIQSALANNFIYNIAWGARILAGKWLSTPPIGMGNPAVLEDWYYAVWAYNAWGWRNNPNNPAFTRTGTPITNPRAFPYQERVFYLISHPPLDAQGNPSWAPVPVTLPNALAIGKAPGPLPAPLSTHMDAAPTDGPLAFTFTDAVRFRGDISIPDGTVLAPGTLFRKSWLFRNAGGLFWSDYSWRFVGGDRMEAPFSVTVPLAPPLADVPLDVYLVAPAHPGSYRGYWQLFNASGESVGPRAWVAITVSNAAPAEGAVQIAPAVVAATATATVTDTGAISATTGISPLQEAVLHTPTASGDNAAYVADLTIPDGTILHPGQVFTKVWEVQNTGAQAWNSRYHWQFEAGTPMGTVLSVPVPVAPPGETVTFQVRMSAPSRPRTYIGYWQMTDPSGSVFGSQAWVQIRVAAATATPTPTPSSTATPQPTHAPSSTATPSPSAPPSTATATASPTSTLVPTPTPRPTSVPWFGPATDRAFFAEGYTGDGFHEYLSFLNPRPRALRVRISIYRVDGATRIIDAALAPLARRTLDLNALAPGVGTALRIEADAPVVVERGLFTRNGHVVAGAPGPGRHWYVAESYVGAGFRDELRVFNPGDLTAALTINAYRGDGSIVQSRRTVSGGTRANVLLDDIAPIGASSLEIRSTEPVVVESVVRGPGAAGPSAAMALTALSRAWYFPDGGTSRGNEEYIALLNPGATGAHVRLYPVTSDGYQPHVTLLAGPHSRTVFVVHDLLRVGGLACVITSDRPIVAQEVRYARTGGVSVVDGAPRPMRTWGFAEGHTGRGFKEWLTVLNPERSAVSVTVRLVTGRGIAHVAVMRVRGRHREYLYLNGLVRNGPVSAIVEAERPIVVGRTMIFNAGNGLSTTVGVALSGGS